MQDNDDIFVCIPEGVLDVPGAQIRIRACRRSGSAPLFSGRTLRERPGQKKSSLVFLEIAVIKIVRVQEDLPGFPAIVKSEVRVYRNFEAAPDAEKNMPVEYPDLEIVS